MRVFEKSPFTIRAPQSGRSSIIATMTVGGTDLASSFLLTNITKDCRADLQMLKALNGDFIFNTFGDAIVRIVLSGISKTTSDPCGRILTVEDAEDVYHTYKISSPNRALVKVAWSTKKVYSGYMVSFSQKPLNNNMVDAAGYDIVILATLSNGLTGGSI